MKTELAVHFISRCPPARFARLGTGLLAALETDRRPRLILASLSDDALLLGRFQRTAGTLDLARVRERGVPVARRLGGGRAVQAGEGTLGLLLGLPDPSSFLPRPVGADKVLNRHVRGLCAGIASAGVGAYYFGRDYLSAERRQIARLSQDGGPAGGVIVEALIGVARSLEPARSPEPAGGLVRARAHSDPRSAGPPFASLEDLLARRIEAGALARAIAEGYARSYSCALVEEDLSFSEGPDPVPPVDEEEALLAASEPREVPIGFVEALVRVQEGRIATARLRGDFIAPAFVIEALEASLVGCALEATSIGRTIDAAFRRPGATILGVTALRVFVEALLAAGARDRPSGG